MRRAVTFLQRRSTEEQEGAFYPVCLSESLRDFKHLTEDETGNRHLPSVRAALFLENTFNDSLIAAEKYNTKKQM
ncbi:hypothetical protein CesoFtcFv8_000495 [Champsocephalus esox]|uniref:Uncharacterized protein n=1 Tax=Champsocephalus esox TaxID=159716 RepID=A0AAN8D2V9_9TELE|nr:hypothetical protein CesoFtcFv8_000495 [Champsocephalus esox]